MPPAPAPVQTPTVTQTPAPTPTPPPTTTPAPTATPTPTPTPAPTQTPPPTRPKPLYHPPEIRTGNPQVDQVIDATLEGQIPTLERLVTLVPVRCVVPTQAGGPGQEPVCQKGQAEGTLIPAFAHDSCEAHYETDLAAAKATMAAFFRAPLGLQSVYPLTRTEEAGVYAILFVTTDKGEPRSIYVNGAGRIIGVQIGCVGTMVNQKYLLAPPQ